MTTVYLDGAFVPKDEARLSPDDRGFLFGDGVYEVVRVIDGRLVEVERHLARFRTGADALRLGLDAAGGEAAVRRAWEELIARNGLTEGEALCYTQLTRGAAPRAHVFPPAGTRPTLYAYAQRLVPPDALRATGAAAITYPDLRWARCELKTVNLLPNVLARQAAQEAGAFEAVLVRAPADRDADVVSDGAPDGAPNEMPNGTPDALPDDGVVTEGSLSSVFAVVDGVLRTHPRTPRILPSITRALVLDLATALGIAAEERACTLAELRRAEELFVANTTADVMPVVTLDGRPFGTGRPGAVTTRLGEALAGRIGRTGVAGAPAAR